MNEKRLTWIVTFKKLNELYKSEVLAINKNEALSLGERLIKNESFGLLGWQIADITLKT
jgi:hypothetical protein